MIDINTCPVCENSANVEDVIGYDAYFVRCKLCGNYFLETDCLVKDKIYSLKTKSSMFFYFSQNNLDSKSKKNISHFHNQYNWEDGIEDSNNHNFISLKSLQNLYPENINEQIEKILLNLAYLIKYVGNNFEINRNGGDSKYYHIFFVDDTYGNETINKQLYELLNILIEQNLIKLNNRISSGNTDNYTLTSKGWAIVQNLQSKNKTENAFIAMWFDNDGSMDLAREKIKQAIVDCGYIPVLIDEKEHNEFIVPEILSEIRNSQFVIADFTGKREGVYFEAGYAKGQNKEVIMTCKEEDFKSHFDTKQISHILWKDENDLYNRLIKRIQATI